jgi:hypothetical protein
VKGDSRPACYGRPAKVKSQIERVAACRTEPHPYAVIGMSTIFLLDGAQK